MGRGLTPWHRMTGLPVEAFLGAALGRQFLPSQNRGAKRILSSWSHPTSHLTLGSDNDRHADDTEDKGDTLVT